MNMSEAELQLVADHMGHSVNIHTTVYRLQQNLMERSKMALILEAAEQGACHRYPTEKSLDQINIADILRMISGIWQFASHLSFHDVCQVTFYLWIYVTSESNWIVYRC